MDIREEYFDLIDDSCQSENYYQNFENQISDLKENHSHYFMNLENPNVPKISEMIHSKENNVNDQSKRIFIIIKLKREKQKHNYPDDPKKRLHTFKSQDNMIKIIKIHFFNFLLKLSNDFIFYETKNSRKKLINILNDFKTDVTIKLNLILLDFTIKELFSLPISKKYVKYNKDHNIKLIEELSKFNFEFSIFFNHKISYMILLYSDKNQKNTLLKKFKMKTATPLYEYVKLNKNFKKKKPEYIKEIINLGKNFLSYFQNKKERTSQLKKKLFVYINYILNDRKNNK
jgi:hypothetical protein